MGYYDKTFSSFAGTCESAHEKVHTRVSPVSVLGFRLYSPAIGRWASRDPLGDEGFFIRYVKIHGQNQIRVLRNQSLRPSYLFLENEPVQFVDANGLFSLNPAKYLGGLACATWIGRQDIGGTDAYRHCMSSCALDKCLTVVMGPLEAAIATLGAGVIIEIWDDIIGRANTTPPTMSGHIADIISNLKGVIGGLTNLLAPCEESCKCERKKNNPV